MERFPENWTFEVDFDGYNISVGHRQQGGHRVVLMGGIISSSKGKSEKRGNVFCSKFLKNARGPINQGP